MKKTFILSVLVSVLVSGAAGCSKEDGRQDARLEQATVPLSENAGEAIDLGLSVKWADRDLPGKYAWGETESKSKFSPDNYIFCNDGQYTEIGGNICGSKYDAARMIWGGDWRMPTKDELLELFNNCSWSQHGSGSYQAEGANGNTIVLDEETMLYANSGYWSSSQFGSYSDCAYAAGITSNRYLQPSYKYVGLRIRPVMDK